MTCIINIAMNTTIMPMNRKYQILFDRIFLFRSTSQSSQHVSFSTGQTFPHSLQCLC